MKLKLSSTIRHFGTLIVFTLFMSACSSTYQMTSYDDDVYYAQKDSPIEISKMSSVDDNYEEYGSPLEQQVITEEQTTKNTRSREINRTIFSSIAYAMLEGLYIFSIWCN